MAKRKDSKDKLIIEVEEYVSLPTNVAGLIQALTELSNKFGSSLVVYPGDPDCVNDYLISYEREETDKEYNTRQSELQKARERAEKQRKNEQEKVLAKLAKTEKEERELYEKLKKKYS